VLTIPGALLQIIIGVLVRIPRPLPVPQWHACSGYFVGPVTQNLGSAPYRLSLISSAPSSLTPAVCGYVAMGILGVIFIPKLYPPCKWYYVLLAYFIGPLLAIPNSYGCGLTDWDMSSM